MCGTLASIGLVCRTCDGGVCRERIDPLTPMRVACPSCNGGEMACPVCGGDGTFKVTGCPTEQAAAAGVFDVIRARTFLDKGLPPVAGGYLDQSATFIDAIRIIETTIHKSDADRQTHPFNRD